MRITNVHIENFRLLQNVDINFSKSLTVVVGRNNSGKTSLTALFYRLLSDKILFKIEDFSVDSLHQFWSAYQAYRKDEDYDDLLPQIKIEFIVDYSEDETLGTLSPFIIDLNPECFEAKIVGVYAPRVESIESYFDDITSDDISELDFNQNIARIIGSTYEFNLYSVDVNNSENFRSIESGQLKALLKCGFINAQRELNDDTITDKHGVLAAMLEKLFINTKDSEDLDEQKIIDSIEESIQGVQETLDGAFKDELKKLFPTFNLFGYPGLSDPNLTTKTTLDATRLLKGHTSVKYAGVNGFDLPENYNGLGSRNLIYILLHLYDSFMEYKNSATEPGVNVIFIEEPEAHLHPQMQEVFTDQLNQIVYTFSETFNDGKIWPVQFVVTTHSSHIANRASFSDIQYFLSEVSNEDRKTRQSKVKNLQALSDELGKENKDFLHKYLTLTKCDLFFADKAILIEGTAERLFLPTMIDKVESEYEFERNLSSQFISTIEVGGAYAYLFFPLLDFLEIPTLIITDIDSVKIGESKRYKSCLVSDGEYSSNNSINTWSKLLNTESEEKATIDELLSLADNDKVIDKKRIAYQVSEVEDNIVGRSLEESFINANRSVFELEEVELTKLEQYLNDTAQEYKKSEFALKYTIEHTDWNVPKYIADGLVWLAQQNLTLITLNDAEDEEE